MKTTSINKQKIRSSY